MTTTTQANTITIGNATFAKNDAAFTDSLFNSGGTCDGFYRVTKHTVIFMDHQKKKIGLINKHGVLCKASQPGHLNGKWWYSLTTIECIGEVSSLDVHNLKSELMTK